MSNPHNSMIYEIKVEGHLGQQWASWFEGAAITLKDNGDTLLTCPVADQAALYGLLKKVRDLGVPLVSIVRVAPAAQGCTPADAILNQTSKGSEMQAIVYTEYGSADVLKLQKIEKPTPKDHQVLIKVEAAALNAADWHLMRGDPFLLRLQFGLRQPKNPILGADVAGRVEAVGKNVTRFRPGDEVFGDISGGGFGALGEYVCADADSLVSKPAQLTFEQAAAAPMAAVTALQGLRDKGQIRAGQKVLINGASGGVGTFAVQIAKMFGAAVTAVCSTQKVELVRSLGADHVIDYTKEDFTQNGQRYDLILAANGDRSLWDYRRSLSPQGIYVMTGGSPSQMFQAILLGPLLSLGGSQKLGNLLAQPNQKDLELIRGWLAAGKLAPVIDKCYPLSEVAEAMRYLEKGHARGKVIVRVGS